MKKQKKYEKKTKIWELNENKKYFEKSENEFEVIFF